MAAAKTPANAKSSTEKPAEPAAAAATMYQVISPLDRDGKRYAIGDQVELTADQADPLLGHTVREPVAAQAGE